MNIVLSLFECEITLYPQTTAGAPVVSSPLWIGACAESVTVGETWLKKETRPTGRRYPHQHPLVAQFEINIGRLWLVRDTDRVGYIPTRQPMVMDMVWREEETGGWRRETFYGVTIESRTRASKDLDAEDGAAYTEQQQFSAEYYVASSGFGAPPALTSSVAYRVVYQSSSELLDLYSYDVGSELFTALASTAGRATLTYAPTDRSGVFNVAFNGAAPAAVVSATGDLTAAVFVAGAPTLADLPRLNFYAGTQRIASISAAGVVFATSFAEGTPTDGLFLYGGGARRVGITPVALTAVNLVETAPASEALLTEGGDSLTTEDGDTLVL